MGERVYVGPVATSVQSPRDGEPLNYANAEQNPRFPAFHRALSRARWVFGEIMTVLRPSAIELVKLLGGPRQIIFAFGLSFVLAGIGAALSPYSEASAFMCIGGLLVGLALRLPWTRS